MSEKKQVPLRESLFTWPSDKPCLLGSRCRACGEVFFPKQDICSYCSKQDLEEIALSKRGKLLNFTCVRHRPKGEYQGPVPYCIGWVGLPEGVKILSLLTENNIEALKIGMNLELVIEQLYQDEEGNEVMTFKWKPD